MQTNDRILICCRKSIRAGTEDDAVNTLGERIASLLRTAGIADRGERYQQAELSEMLMGKREARNGKWYNLPYATESHISKMVQDKLLRIVPEEITAIADILDSDEAWLLSGRVLAEPEQKPGDIYMTPEAGEIAAYVDRLPANSRLLLLDMAKRLAEQEYEIKRQRQIIYEYQAELRDALRDHMRTLDAAGRERINSILREMQLERGVPNGHDTQ